ncbi:hypothetical protein OHA72_54450 [Dactylosporangium sp. NBC_01737]|nr:hypothetical protein OHA72_54450 [Dactylosporangium sp. NBC_01737]
MLGAQDCPACGARHGPVLGAVAAARSTEAIAVPATRYDRRKSGLTAP